MFHRRRYRARRSKRSLRDPDVVTLDEGGGHRWAGNRQSSQLGRRSESGQLSQDRFPPRLMSPVAVGHAGWTGRDDERSPPGQLLGVHPSEPLPGVSNDVGVPARRALHEREDQERQSQLRGVDVDGDDIWNRYFECHHPLAGPRLSRDLRRWTGLEYQHRPIGKPGYELLVRDRALQAVGARDCASDHIGDGCPGPVDADQRRHPGTVGGYRAT